MENGDSGSKKRKSTETEELEEGSKPKKGKTYLVFSELASLLLGPDDPVFTERPSATTNFIAQWIV